MPETIFHGIFDTATTQVIPPEYFLLCVAVSLAVGLILSCMARWRMRSSESFGITLVLLPAAVCVVIMMVNGNVGTGVAVAGAFGLVRFRSSPGSGREISAVFIAMGAGLLAGMGYLAYAVLFTVLMGGTMMLCTMLGFGCRKKDALFRELRITIPESLNYSEVFDNILAKYTTQYALRQVKSTNLGSMFKLTYDITLREGIIEKNMLDELRCLNGNLEISLSYQETEITAL